MKKTLFAALLCAAGLMASCGGQKKATFDELLGEKWVLTEVLAGDSVETPPANVYLQFTDSLFLYGRAGCNTFRGKFEVPEQGAVKIETGPMTLMFCMNMDFETRYLDYLVGTVSYGVENRQLRLSDADGSRVMLYVPETDLPKPEAEEQPTAGALE